MAWAPNYKDTKVLGCFRNKETGAFFEYDAEPLWKISGADHALFMSDGTKRTARVLKTVVYVAIDEDEYGNAVWDKWQIKDHRMYNN